MSTVPVAYPTEKAARLRELIEPIIHQTVSVELLASFCCVSHACASIARQQLYRELQVIDDPQYVSPFLPGAKLGIEARERRLDTILNNPHLWAYIRALTLSIDDPSSKDQKFAPRFTAAEILQKIELSNVDHIFLQIGRKNPCSGHFRIVNPLRGGLEGILASPSMKSISLDLFTLCAPNSPFPGWIFRGLSDTVKNVQLTIRYPGWADGKQFHIPPTVPTQNPEAILGSESSGPKRVLEGFSLVVHNNHETMGHCVAILSGLCFNFSFFQMKRLEISHIDNDAGMWIIPDLSAGTLLELTILNFPNRNPFMRKNHFSTYRHLRCLSLQISLSSVHRYNTCQSLIDLFKQPLPSTLQSVVITVDFGKLSERYDVPHLFDPNSPSFVDHGCWRELSQTIAESQFSLRTLTILLSWTVILPPTGGPTLWTLLRDEMGREEALSFWHQLEPEDRQRELNERQNPPGVVAQWKQAVRIFIIRWKELFAHVGNIRGCNLDVRVKIRQQQESKDA